MRPLYSLQFEIASLEQSQQHEVPNDVLKVIASWICEWYLFRQRTHIAFPLEGGRITPAHNHELSVLRSFSADRSVSHTEVSWSYPYEIDGNLRWHSRCDISAFNNLTEVSFQLFAESIQFYIAPVDFVLRRPRVVATLLRQFVCTNGDSRLSLEPAGLSVERMREFVDSALLSSRRRLPIVVVSRNLMSEKWLVDPGELAERLAGIAQVYVLDDKWAGYALTEEVGKMYSCFNGAVRLYWPDFNPSEAPYSPVYIPDRVAQLGSQLVEATFKQLAAISAFRFLPGPVAVDAVDFLQEEKRLEMERMRVLARDSNDYSQLLDLSDKENDRLRESVQRLSKENEDLRAGLQLSQDNVRVIWQAQENHSEPSSEGAIPADEDGDADTVSNAVEIAKKKFKQTLIFQDSATDSAEKSPFRQPKKVLHALEAMHEVCLAWRRSIETKAAAGSWEQQFEKKGFTYKARESSTSKGKWGEEYETVYKGEKVSIEQHLSVGKGGPDTCLRIHFYVDEASQQLVIAHVGKHKTNTSS